MPRFQLADEKTFRDTLPNIIGGVISGLVVSGAVTWASAPLFPTLPALYVLGGTGLVFAVIFAGALRLRLWKRHHTPPPQTTPTIAPDSITRSLEMLDEADRYLSNIANEIGWLLRPYTQDAALPISTLYGMWTEQHTTQMTESDFRKIMARLQDQHRLIGIVCQGDRLFVDEEHYSWKTTVAVDEKQQIARKAASLIESGDVIVLDSGSTSIEIARQISQGIRLHRWTRLVVITNFFKAADELLAATSAMSLEDNTDIVRVFMVGGRIRLNTLAIVGDDVGPDHTLTDFDSILQPLGGADVAFVGTNGVCSNVGFTTTSLSETRTKQAMLKWAKRKYIVTDPSKFGLKQENVFATFDEGLQIITTRSGDKRVLLEYERLLKQTNTQLIYA